jgi:hypothetical protein
MYNLSGTDFEPLPKRTKLVRSRNVLELKPNREWNEFVYNSLISGENECSPHSPPPIRLFKKRNLSELSLAADESIDGNISPKTIKRSKSLYDLTQLKNTPSVITIIEPTDDSILSELVMLFKSTNERIEMIPDYMNKLAADFFTVNITNNCTD